MEKKNNQKFQEILNAGAKIFHQKGYHNANISDIAKEVGILKGSLYYYIKSKEELLSFVIGPPIKIYVKNLVKILDSDDAADVMLEKAVIAHMSTMDVNFDSQAVFLKELVNLPEPAKSEILVYVDKYKELWLELINRGISQKIFRDDIDKKVILLSILGMTNWTFRWYKPGREHTAKDIGRMYTRFILDGLKTK